MKSNVKLIVFSVLIHLIITLPLAYILNAWADEASSLYSTQHGFLHAFQSVSANEKQAPLYFWALSIWRSVDSSIFFARILSIIFSIASIVLFVKIAGRWLNEHLLYFASFAFALHPYLIWASIEIRVYSLIIFLTLALLETFIRAFVQEDEKPKAKFYLVLFWLLSITSLYTNYYLGFILVGLFVVLLIRLDLRAAFKYLILMTFAGLLFLPHVIEIAAQFSERTGDHQEAKTLVECLQIIWNISLTFLVPTEIFPIGDITVISFIRLWLMRVVLVLFVIYFIIKRPKLSFETIYFVVITLVVIFWFVVVYWLLGSVYLNIRHAAVLFVPLILTIFLLVRDLLKENVFWYKSLILIAGVILLGLYGYSLLMLYPGAAKRGDWYNVAEFIENNEKAEQPIVIFPPFDALALPLHYKGVNTVLPQSGYFELQFVGGYGSPESLRRQNQVIIDTIPKDANELWLIIGAQCGSENECQLLQTFISENYVIINETDFYVERVLLLRKIQK